MKVKSGDVAYAIYLKEHLVKGRLYNHNDAWYFLQNQLQGGKPNNGETLGHSYSWNLGCSEFRKETQGVEFITKEEYDNKLHEYRKQSVYIDGILKISIYVNGDLIMMFNITAYPDCCGSKILHDFSEISYLNPMPTKNQFYRIRKGVLKASGVDHMTAMLPSASYDAAHTFLLNIGFKRIDEFKSFSTGKFIAVYSYNSK